MIDPLAKSFDITTPDGVRAYGLWGKSADQHGSLFMAYAHHYATHDATTTAELAFQTEGLPPLAGCSGVWVHPETGATETASTANGTNFTTPPFAIDIALRLVCKKTMTEVV